MTQTEIALYLRGKEGNRTSYAEERTEDLEKYGILVVGQDQDRPGMRLEFCILRVLCGSQTEACGLWDKYLRWWLRLQAELLWTCLPSGHDVKSSGGRGGGSGSSPHLSFLGEGEK